MEHILVSGRILGLLGSAVKTLDAGIEKGVTFEGTITIESIDGFAPVQFVVTFDGEDVHWVGLALP